MGPRWSSPADAGHSAARAAVEPPAAGVTDAGLPQRDPLAQLVPGAIDAPDRPASGPDVAARPAPADLEDRLASYQDGLAEGRADRPGETPEPIPHPIFGDHR